MDENPPVVIITGAAGAMGSAVVRLLAHRQVCMMCVDKNGEALKQLAESIDADLVTVTADVTSEPEIKAIVDTTVERWGRITGLANIAAMLNRPQKLIDTDTGVFDETMCVNVRSVWLAMKYVIPVMITAGGGSIVNVGSHAAVRGAPNIAPYAASKHAVVGLTQTVALEYATQNVRANVLNPGAMDTWMIREMFPSYADGDAIKGEQVMLSRIPQRRLARPDELGKAAVWLLLDAPEHMSGQVFSVDGARTAG